MREIEVGDGGQSGDFPWYNAGQRITAQVQVEKLLAVANVPGNCAVKIVTLKLDPVEISAANEVWDFTCELARTGGEDLEVFCFPYV